MAAKISLNDNPPTNSCWTKVIESEWTDVALITGCVALLIIGIAASEGVFNAIGTSNAEYLSNAMFVGAATLFVFAIVKRIVNCCKKTEQANKTVKKSQDLTAQAFDISNNNDNFKISELLAEAENQFAFHPLREDILAQLRTDLPAVVQSNRFAHGTATMYASQEEAQKQHAIEDALESFFYREDLFKNLDRYSYGGCILSREKFKREVLEEAKKFIKSISSEEDQKAVLNYIRQVAYDRNFLEDPAAFINKWIQDRGNNPVHRFPSDNALSFFKAILGM